MIMASYSSFHARGVTCRPVAYSSITTSDGGANGNKAIIEGLNDALNPTVKNTTVHLALSPASSTIIASDTTHFFKRCFHRYCTGNISRQDAMPMAMQRPIIYMSCPALVRYNEAMLSLSPRHHLSRLAFEILVISRRQIVTATARTNLSGSASALTKLICHQALCQVCSSLGINDALQRINLV